MAKEYELNFDARILELLGPNLYTNIYYVLAELIANAYDADAHNVWIVESETAIRVEDDGKGMSYAAGDIKKFLNVAGVSRTTEEESVTGGGRRKMGRKGVGKLAALSVAQDVDVMTVSSGDRSGFVLTRRPPDSKLLQEIPESQIQFDYVTDHGTAIVMRNPEYGLHKTMAAIRRNLLKLFPVVGPDFKIHVIRGTEEVTIDDFDRNIMRDLSTLITLGREYADLAGLVPDAFPSSRSELVQVRDPFVVNLRMPGRDSVKRDYTLEVVGWIGTYKSTRELKAERTDFPDNFISLFANGKLGEFNILPIVGQNRLSEVFVVGQLHADLFERTDLPDMALSNRQGYRSDDPRYEAVLDFARDLLGDVRRMRDTFTDLQKSARDKQKQDEQLANEERLRQNVDAFRSNVVESAAEALELAGVDGASPTVKDAIQAALSQHSPDLGLKAIVDSQKRKLLISHTGKDQDLADVVYQMVLFNGAPPDEIIYTHSENEDSRVPHGEDVLDYLRNFFVESYSTEKVFVLFVTSEEAGASWGVVVEVGGAWVTRKDHEIFNIPPYRPQKPLDNNKEWQVTVRDAQSGMLSMDKRSADVFCQKIEAVCTGLGYETRSRADNMDHLRTLLTIV